MRTFINILCVWILTVTAAASQNHENLPVVSTFKLDTILRFETYGNQKNAFLEKPTTFSFFDASRANRYNNFGIDQVNGEALSSRAIPTLRFAEHTHIDYTDYIRGCGSLEDGITKTVNSRDVMLSILIDTFVNDYLFKDLLFKN